MMCLYKRQLHADCDVRPLMAQLLTLRAFVGYQAERAAEANPM
jgi:hypothetical protein